MSETRSGVREWAREIADCDALWPDEGYPKLMIVATAMLAEIERLRAGWKQTLFDNYPMTDADAERYVDEH